MPVLPPMATLDSVVLRRGRTELLVYKITGMPEGEKNEGASVKGGQNLQNFSRRQVRRVTSFIFVQSRLVDLFSSV